MALSVPLSVGKGVGGRHHLHLKEAFLHIKERLSSHQQDAPFTSTECPLCLQTILFTPLSIRRGVGGEAVVGEGERL